VLGDILILGVAVRMAVGAGRRSPAYYMVISAIVAVLATDSIYGWILLHGSYHPGDPLDGGWIVYYVLWGAGALHPSMRTVSQAAATKVRLTAVRILAIATAALIAPVIELVKASRGGGSNAVVIGSAAIVLFALVIVRMVGLARDQQAAAEREHTMRRAADALVTATSTAEIILAAQDAAAVLAGPTARPTVLQIEPRGRDRYLVGADRRGGAGDLQIRLALLPQHLLEQLDRRVAVDFDSAEAVTLGPGFGTTPVFAVPILAQGQLAGAIALLDATAATNATRTSLETLAAQVGLALESAALTESVLRTQSEARLSALVQHSTDVILVVARDTTIEYASPSVHQILGYDAEDLIGRPLADYIADQDRAHVQRALAVLLASAPETSHAFEFRVRHGDGCPVHTECLAGNLLSNPAVGGIVVNLRDTTERNRVAAEVALARDQAVEASNMKSAFLANVSHEIRTPMNGVIGMNELLLGTNLDDEQRAYATQVARSSEHMLTIITDILDIAKIETGKIELHIAEFDLRETVEQACMPAILEAQAKRLQFDLEIDPRLPPRVRGDAARVHQILLNLVYNAVKFAENGTINVRIAPPDSGDADIIRFEVTDTGIGIEPAQLDRMFEPFVQADVSMTPQYGGSGLGLAIAKDLVERMHGTIDAHSTPGSGSTFAFEIALPHAGELPAPTSHTRDVHLAPWPAGSTAPLILVAEDSPVNRLVAVSLLERCGFRAHAVNDGLEALVALATTRYDAVLMDCQMPVLDGYEATQELRRREHGTDHTPVIAMTAHAMLGDRERCLDAGMDDYLTKPIRHTDLSATLRRWISNSPSTSRASEPLVPVEQ
jgi:PAS domain S-box-containing protein